jgi:hypothetical protein
MNWKLILRMSALGLIMAMGSVFLIPSILESICWLILFLLYAWQIGKYTSSFRFLHGLVLGILNSVWITLIHDLFLERYLARHPREIATIALLHNAHISGSPRALLAGKDIFFGVCFGIVIGVFAMVAGLMARPRILESTP